MRTISKAGTGIPPQIHKISDITLSLNIYSDQRLVLPWYLHFQLLSCHLDFVENLLCTHLYFEACALRLFFFCAEIRPIWLLFRPLVDKITVHAIFGIYSSREGILIMGSLVVIFIEVLEEVEIVLFLFYLDICLEIDLLVTVWSRFAEIKILETIVGLGFLLFERL